MVIIFINEYYTAFSKTNIKLKDALPFKVKQFPPFFYLFFWPEIKVLEFLLNI